MDGKSRRRRAGGLALLLWLACGPAAGCARSQDAGGVLGAMGVMTALVGLSVATGCPVFDDEDDPDDDCVYDEEQAEPETGLPIAAAGLGILGLGALLIEADEE